jgi:hypothetical protein
MALIVSLGVARDPRLTDDLIRPKAMAGSMLWYRCQDGVARWRRNDERQ